MDWWRLGPSYKSKAAGATNMLPSVPGGFETSTRRDRFITRDIL
jgi:hypothetical protein